MLEIRCTKQDEVEVSGSAPQLTEIAHTIYKFLDSDSESIVFEANRSAVPSPYDSVLFCLKITKGEAPAKASVVGQEEIVVEGSPESLRAFASFFEFALKAPKLEHSHFEYEEYEGNRFVSRGSIPMIICVR